MKSHDNSTRNIFNKIHLSQNKNKFSLNKIRYRLNEKILYLKKGYFKGKICVDLGCGSTGSGGYNLLNLGAKYCHLLDMHEHIIKPVNKNLEKFKGKFEISIGSIEKLPYKKETFDFVLCQGVIHHMDNDLKAFKEIYKVLNKGGYAYITVHGEGGLINDLTMKFLRPRYQNDKVFKKFIDAVLSGNIKPFNFLKKNYTHETKKILEKFEKLFDNDLLLTIDDRLKAPKYKTYKEKFLKNYLKKIGFKEIKRIKKKVKFNNIRRFVEPLYHHYDNDLAKILYGDGIIQLVIKK